MKNDYNLAFAELEKKKEIYNLWTVKIDKLITYLKYLLTTDYEDFDIYTEWLIDEAWCENELEAIFLFDLAEEIGILKRRYYLYCSQTQKYLANFHTKEDFPEKSLAGKCEKWYNRLGIQTKHDTKNECGVDLVYNFT